MVEKTIIVVVSCASVPPAPGYAAVCFSLFSLLPEEYKMQKFSFSYIHVFHAPRTYVHYKWNATVCFKSGVCKNLSSNEPAATAQVSQRCKNLRSNEPSATAQVIFRLMFRLNFS